MWVFVLLGMEAIRTYKANPYLVVGTHHIPTWTTPIALLLCVAALVPSSSFLGHLAGLVVGYICGSPLLLDFLSLPCSNQRARRWLRIPQVSGAAGKGAALGRGKAEPPWAAATLRQRGPEDVRPVRRAAFVGISASDECCVGLGWQYTAIRALMLTWSSFCTAHRLCLYKHLDHVRYELPRLGGNLRVGDDGGNFLFTYRLYALLT
jgi:hypothetical protein